jgi:hypothetical protein
MKAQPQAWAVWGQISDEHVPFHWGYYIATETEISRLCLDWLWLRSNEPEFTIWAIPETEEELERRTNIRLVPTQNSDYFHELIETGG